MSGIVEFETPDYTGRPVWETNDCTVRATVAATGLPYATVYRAFDNAGRRKGEGPRWPEQAAAWRALGYKPVRTSHSDRARTVGTLAKLRARECDTAPIVVYTARHLTAFVNTRCSEPLPAGIRIRKREQVGDGLRWGTYKLVKIAD